MMLNDSKEARQRMIDGQLTPNKITCDALIAAMKLVPREFFVPIGFTGSAYVDEEIPLGGGRMLMEPLVLAQLIQALDLAGTERVLILGGAMGYSAAVLAHLAAEVVMVEEQPELLAHAQSSLPLLGLRNVELLASPLGAPQVEGKFDAVLIEGAIQRLPETIPALLKNLGRLAYVENRALRADGLKGAPTGLGRIVRAVKRSGRLSPTILNEAGVTLLPAFAAEPAFAFA